jgi:DNA-directed RNA polymerase
MASTFGYRPIDDIPFENLNNGQQPESQFKYGDMPSLSDLRPFEYSSPLMLGGTLATAPRKYRNGNTGVGGEAHEILSVLEACLQVGRLERAEVILKRIQFLGAIVDEHAMAQLHNKYLRAAVEQIMMKPSLSATQAIHTWFELEIRRKAIPFNADTVAYMLKASLQTQDIAKRDRLVRRYMDMVQGDHGLEVLGLDILNAKELNQITHICPTYNLAEGLEFEEDDMDAFETKDKVVSGPDSPIPAVRPVGQKGLGLKALKKSLSLFTATETVNMENLTNEEKREIQGKLEEDAVSSAIERWREENSNLTKMGLNTSLQTKSLGARMWRWQEALEVALQEELEKVEEAELKERKMPKDMERCLYGPFLRLIPADKLSAVTILAVMTAFGALGVDKGLPLSTAIMAIATSVEEEALFEVVQKESKATFWGKSKKIDGKLRVTPEMLKKTLRIRGTASTQRETDTVVGVLSENQWPMAMKAKVGAFLMSALIETARIPVAKEHPETKEVITQMQPAFSHAHQYKMGRKIGTVVANTVLVNQMKREPVHSLLAKHLPMLVEPEPWTHFNKGGFISHPAKVMRIKLGDKDQRHYAEAAIGKGDMEQVFKGLDVLGKTSWRINQPVFDVMLEAWNSGEAIANIAPENPNLQIPPEPEPSKDPLERRRWIREVKIIENARSGYHSQRCFQNFQLEIARALRNEVFYFPHNVDFRGRAYPIPPYLNHMGADHCRGLLTFGKGKELGQSGLRWLKIHLANVFGFDKASLREREEFTTKNLSDIYDSASKPLTGNRWWLKAEDPWQTLAACMELKNALESPDPTKFVSRLPVHQDGTCNGLQHYAALGGDVWGAKQVNLEPGDRPADIYSAVADIVKEGIAKDAEKGVTEAQILKGRITRKTVKQTVMTNVYGVTYIGAKAQVRRQLVAAYDDLPNEAAMNPGILAAYIAKKIFIALSSMFQGAHDIQYWLGECAGRISTGITPEQMDRMESELPQGPKDKSGPVKVENSDQFKSSVIWTTPLHMPVVQPYREAKSKMVKTNMQQLYLSEPHRSDPISKRKQLQAFPPNFIHSLDATHMILSALKCDEMGLSFAAVHDSFWTHASDIDAMNGVLRDAFVRIHSDDVIGRLSAEFAARYKGCMYLAKVRPGTAVYRKIISLRTSKKVPTKQAKTTELLLERKRLRLLASSDPKEVEEGKNMVTPGSVWEELAGEEDLAPEEGLKEVTIGKMPAREARSTDDEDIDVDDMGIDGGLTASDSSSEASHFAGSGELTSVREESEPEEKKLTFEKEFLQDKRHVSRWSSWVWLPLTFPPVPKKVRSPFSEKLRFLEELTFFVGEL